MAPPPHLDWLVTTGARLETLERAAAAGPDALRKHLRTEGAPAPDGALAVAPRWAGGLRDETLALAERIGWPAASELEGFASAVRSCPLELVIAGLWDGPDPGRRRIARYVVAIRLHAVLASRSDGSPEIALLAEVLAEDVCRELLPGRGNRLADSAAGGQVVDRVARILERLARSREPQYLASALELRPVHAYNTLRKFLRDYDVRRAHGSLCEKVRRVQDAPVSPDFFDRRDPGSRSPGAARLPRAVARKVGELARRFFGDRSVVVQRILILKSLGFGSDAEIATAVDLARETVNRRLSEAREEWRDALRAGLTVSELDAYSSAIQDWSGWAELVPPTAWPPLPAGATALALEGILPDHDHVRRFLAGPGRESLAEALVSGRPVPGELLSRRAEIAAFELETARSQCLSGDLSAIDAQFVHAFAGLHGRGIDLSHVSTAVRFFSRLSRQERELLAHAGAPPAEKHRLFLGELGYERVKSRLCARRRELEDSIFPGVEPASAGDHGGEIVEEEQRHFDRQAVLDVIAFLAQERWIPFDEEKR